MVKLVSTSHKLLIICRATNNWLLTDLTAVARRGPVPARRGASVFSLARGNVETVARAVQDSLDLVLVRTLVSRLYLLLKNIELWLG